MWIADLFVVAFGLLALASLARSVRHTRANRRRLDERLKQLCP